MANFTFTGWKGNTGSATSGAPALATDSLKVMLLTSAYSPDQDAQVIYADISANELAGTNGYTTGGAALSGVAWSKDAANHRYKLTASNTTWANSSFTMRYAVLYDNSTSGKYLISLYDPGQQLTTTSGTFAINWDATNGVLDLQ